MDKFKKKTFHELFLIVIILKGLHGILELIGGLAFIFIKSSFIVKIINTIFKHELIQDPKDLIANFLIQTSQHISPNTMSFATIYLLTYGIINIGLFFGLLHKKIWTYTLAGFVLILLIIYQIFRIFNTHSLILIFLTILDILIIILLRFEYQKVKKSLKNN